MRIAFICGSLEPGRDGVGDYVRRLSIELIDKGHQIMMVSIRDHYVKEIIEEFILNSDNRLFIVRIPSSNTKSSRFKKLKSSISNFVPDWVSLQYVPFSFHPKGLSLSLCRDLKSAISNVKWHFMVHEIGVGLGKDSNIKFLIWGFWQKILLRDLIRNLKPKVVNTHVDVYKQVIENYFRPVAILPIFSNIPVKFNLLKKEATLNKEYKIIDVVVFASIQHGAPIAQLSDEAKMLMTRDKLLIRLIFVGRNGSELKLWINNWEQNGLPYEVLGELEEQELSKLFSELKFGIFTTPILLAGKSGAVAAMLEHHIQLICVSRKWESQIDIRGSNSLGLFDYKKGNLHEFFETEYDFARVFNIQDIQKRFIESLRN